MVQEMILAMDSPTKSDLLGATSIINISYIPACINAHIFCTYILNVQTVAIPEL